MAGKMQEITAIYLAEKFRFRNEGEADHVVCLARHPGEVKSASTADIHSLMFGEPESPELTGEFSLAGPANVGELVPHQNYRFFGNWGEYKNKRTGISIPQFKFSSFVAARPSSRAGIITYLAKVGEGLGLGPVRAATIYERFKQDTLRVCREEPARAVAAVNGWSLAQAEQVASKLADQEHLEACSIELVELLDRRGFPKQVARLCIALWGNKAAEMIRRNPFLLMRFRGCGFLRCYAMYLDLGGNPNALKVQALCAWHTIAKNSDGHTWFPLDVAVRGIREMVRNSVARPFDAIKLAKRAGMLETMRIGSDGSIVDKGGQVWVAEAKNAQTERYLADKIIEAQQELAPREVAEYSELTVTEDVIPEFARCTRCRRKLTAEMVAILNDSAFGPDCIQKIPGGELAQNIPLVDWLATKTETTSETYSYISSYKSVAAINPWPNPSDIPEISDHQRDELSQALTSRIGMLGGNPGTGKTFTLAALVKLLIAQYGAQSVAIAAPTGKAAVRVTENLAKYGIGIRAKTVHSLLKVDPMAKSGGGWAFFYREGRPLPFRFIIIDESSMLDASLMSALLAARAAGACILFVGDVNQLPPVGQGAPLRDLIKAGVPYGCLSEIHRNAGRIVQVCKAIVEGKSWKPSGKFDPENGENLILLEATNPADQKQQMLKALAMAAAEPKDASNQHDPVWDCQILTAVNAKSELGRKPLNKILQPYLNPNALIDGSPFKLGDKIVNTQNGNLRIANRGQDSSDDAGDSPDEKYVANGDVARVESVAEKSLIAVLSIGGASVLVPRGKPRGDKAESDEADGDPDPDEKEMPNTGCSWELAYAMSCHKSQGSEWPFVIVMLDEYAGAMRVASREWLLTAISRAKVCCVLIGKIETAYRMCRKIALGDRKTFLVELIRREQVSVLIESL